MFLKDLGWTALLLGVLVTVHELGHFLVAKACGVKVLRFSIGFGPRIFGFTKGETEYRLAWIPLGGYVKMAGEQPYDELSPEEAKRGFLAQPPWKRGLIVAAGPVFNLVFPILVFFIAFLGERDALSNKVMAVDPGLPAAEAGIRPGDRISAVNGAPTRTFSEVVDAIEERYDQPTLLLVERGSEQLQMTVTPARALEFDGVDHSPRGNLGISAQPSSPVVGVPANSAAAAAGLRTFDRIFSVNGVPVKDEAALFDAVEKAEGDKLTLEVFRVEALGLPVVKGQAAGVAKIEVPKAEGKGYARLGGAEKADLYLAVVVPDAPAHKAGIRQGDRIVAIAGQPLRSFTELRLRLQQLGEQNFTITWNAKGVEKTAEVSRQNLEVKDEFGQKMKVMQLGIAPGSLGYGENPDLERVKVKMSVGQAFAASMRVVPEVIAKTGIVIGRMLTLQMDLDNVGGPIMLYQLSAKSAEQGMETYLSMMAAISVNLGLMNLLPIPILDGFHLLAALWEGIRRRPIPARAREVANMVGLAMLLMLMVRVMYNDLTR